MTNVHGISVSGGSFPAEIWRRFMEPALAGRPAREFPEPRQPALAPRTGRRPAALSYDPYYVAPAPAEPEAPAEGEDTPSGKKSSDDEANGPPSSRAQPLQP